MPAGILIERRLLDDVAQTAEDAKAKPAAGGRGAVYAVALGIPVVAVALYLLVGNSAALGVRSQVVPANVPAEGQMPQQAIEANVATLAKRLEQNPDDTEGWTMLGRSYINLEKYSEATNAYAKASALKPQDADLLVEYAFAMAMRNDRQLKGQPADLIKKALQIAPGNPKALELAGSAEFQAKNYKQAIAYWEQLLAKSSSNPDLAQSISERLKEARSLAAAGAK
jgi:cytochrome c-type biogenesis protein CcmH